MLSLGAVRFWLWIEAVVSIRRTLECKVAVTFGGGDGNIGTGGGNPTSTENGTACTMHNTSTSQLSPMLPRNLASCRDCVGRDLLPLGTDAAER